MSIRPLGAVVVNYGSSNLLAEGLPAEGFASARVVVVDNFSSAAERGKITQLAAARGWSLVELADNRGFGAGVNAGVARARELGCECFLLLNPDAEIDESVVRALAEAVTASPRALVSPRLVDREGKPTTVGARLTLTDGRNRRPEPGVGSGVNAFDWLTAASLAVHGDLWDEVGGFEESYFMYWEDVDFGYRCLKAGAQVVLREDLTAMHARGGTQGVRRGRAKSSLYYYYNSRNRLLFAARNLSRREVLRWIAHTPAVSAELLLRGGRRQLLQSLRPLWSVLTGSLRGVGIAVRAIARPAA